MPAREVAVSVCRRTRAEASEAAGKLRCALAISSPVSRGHVSPRRHDDDRAGSAPRNLSRDAAEQRRARPGRTDDDHRCVLGCRRGDEPIGRMANLYEPARPAVDLACTAGNALQSFGDGADLPFGRTILDDANEHQPEAELAAQAAGNSGRPLADSESSTPQMIDPAISILLLRFLRRCTGTIEAAIGRSTHLSVESASSP
jgi:hypothetical protein